MRIPIVLASIAAAVVVTMTGTAHASTGTPRSGCSVPPCGAVQNKADRDVHVRWSNNGEAWKYKWVKPGHTVGGFKNDRLDIDFWEAPANCRSTWHFQGSSNDHVAKGGWVKLESSQTAVVTSIKC